MLTSNFPQPPIYPNNAYPQNNPRNNDALAQRPSVAHSQSRNPQGFTPGHSNPNITPPMYQSLHPRSHNDAHIHQRPSVAHSQSRNPQGFTPGHSIPNITSPMYQPRHPQTHNGRTHRVRKNQNVPDVLRGVSGIVLAYLGISSILNILFDLNWVPRNTYAWDMFSSWSCPPGESWFGRMGICGSFFSIIAITLSVILLIWIIAAVYTRVLAFVVYPFIPLPPIPFVPSLIGMLAHISEWGAVSASVLVWAVLTFSLAASNELFLSTSLSIGKDAPVSPPPNALILPIVLSALGVWMATSSLFGVSCRVRHDGFRSLFR